MYEKKELICNLEKNPVKVKNKEGTKFYKMPKNEKLSPKVTVDYCLFLRHITHNLVR